MGMYLNSIFENPPERLAVEMATNTGWLDFQNWASRLDDFPLVQAFAVKAASMASIALCLEMRKALTEGKPPSSAKAV